VLLKGSQIIGYEIADFERYEPAQAARNRDALESLLTTGKVSPPITARFSLADAAQAVQSVAGRDKLGTTILDIAAPRADDNPNRRAGEGQ
jgi:NADPH2:quinone reductase